MMQARRVTNNEQKQVNAFINVESYNQFEVSLVDAKVGLQITSPFTNQSYSFYSSYYMKQLFHI